MGYVARCNNYQVVQNQNPERRKLMSQTPHTSNVSTGTEEKFALIERREKIEGWLFKLMITAVLILWIVGSIVLLL